MPGLGIDVYGARPSLASSASLSIVKPWHKADGFTMGKPTFLLTTSATRRQYRKRTLRPEGATYGPPTNPCVPYKSLAKADDLPCVSVSAGHSLHCVSEEYRHCLRGEWHCLDEVRMPKVIHAPSSQGNSNCYSPHSTYTLLPPSLHELSQRDTGTQGMTMTVIKVLARISRWLFSLCQGIITRKRLYVMQPHSLLSWLQKWAVKKNIYGTLRLLSHALL